MRAFAGLELGRDGIPDETTILNFRHLLERHELTKAVFAAVAEHLEARGALLRGGTIVDATLIAASPSTKNEAGRRDPEMRSSKKGNQWHAPASKSQGEPPNDRRQLTYCWLGREFMCHELSQPLCRRVRPRRGPYAYERELLRNHQTPDVRHPSRATTMRWRSSGTIARGLKSTMPCEPRMPLRERATSASPTGQLTRPLTDRQNAKRFVMWRKRRNPIQ